MGELIRIKLKNSGRMIDVIPPVARARVASGTATYVRDEDKPAEKPAELQSAEAEVSILDEAGDANKPETAQLAGAPERATAPAQNPPAKSRGRSKG